MYCGRTQSQTQPQTQTQTPSPSPSPSPIRVRRALVTRSLSREPGIGWTPHFQYEYTTQYHRA
ncbi:hypothetical protein JCM24511_05355 [Saitozyma sp. JCM 24511]|nr:hypothetical protein JCM24511_05355 [Saitozyma sp. JCM 24511]